MTFMELAQNRYSERFFDPRPVADEKLRQNLEAGRVMDLENPVPTVYAEVDFSRQKASGKYVCSICGYVYDPAEHDGVAFEDLPEDWRCPRCKQPKEKFSRA